MNPTIIHNVQIPVTSLCFNFTGLPIKCHAKTYEKLLKDRKPGEENVLFLSLNILPMTNGMVRKYIFLSTQQPKNKNPVARKSKIFQIRSLEEMFINLF
jgi:hypothetical protein